MCAPTKKLDKHARCTTIRIMNKKQNLVWWANTDRIVNKAVGKIRKYQETQNPAGRSALLKQMSPEIQVMIRFWSPQDAIEKLRMAAQKDQFRPRDLSIEMFAMRDDLEYVGGAFSTYNYEISKMWRKDTPADEIKFVIREEIQNNLRPVAYQYGEQIARLMNKHEKLAGTATNSLRHRNPSAIGIFLQTLANDMKFELGLHNYTLKIHVVDSWNHIPRRLWNSVDNDTFAIIDFDSRKTWIHINRRTIFADRDKKYKFNAIVATLAHEFGHFIDWVAPDMGALGAQKAVLDSGLYDEKDYYSNATEESSAMIEKIVYQKLNELQRR